MDSISSACIVVIFLRLSWIDHRLYLRYPPTPPRSLPPPPSPSFPIHFPDATARPATMSSSAEPSLTTSAIVPTTASASHVLKINGYSRTKGLVTGARLRSCSFLAGGHSWHLAYLPNGRPALPNGDCPERSDYISFYLVLDGIAVLAHFSIALLDRAGKPAPTYTKVGVTNQFGGPGAHWGFGNFIRREVLEKSRHLNVREDSFCVRCEVTC
ncbi:hypothetical protein HU200_023805 [Digitaria exilis]|uniref:MATH domain-containing protein n=1 Tax=Digitaria exilis TaxID=1010633 RepID=A0A835EWM8_9POAL|nr:hypothetical protein HU200_023805 [Digitaria exilis]